MGLGYRDDFLCEGVPQMGYNVGVADLSHKVEVVVNLLLVRRVRVVGEFEVDQVDLAGFGEHHAVEAEEAVAIGNVVLLLALHSLHLLAEPLVEKVLVETLECFGDDLFVFVDGWIGA